MNGVLTLEEIKKRFPSEWVLLHDVQTNEKYEVLGGNVVFHSSSREETHQKAIELKSNRVAVHYTGERPKDVVLFL